MTLTIWVEPKTMGRMFPEQFALGRYMSLEGFKNSPNTDDLASSPVLRGFELGAWSAGYLSASRISSW